MKARSEQQPVIFVIEADLHQRSHGSKNGKRI